MFRNPFEFKGRITRTEYVLSIILSPILLIFIASYSQDYFHGDFILIFSIIGYFWLNLAQGSKRCHDVNEGGIMQIIPFYGFVLIFKEGTPNNNHYGEDPKSDELKNNKILNKFKDDGRLLDLIQELLPFVLLNSILIALTIKFLNINRFIINTSLYLTIIISYLLFLFIAKKNQYSFGLRFMYCLLVFIIVRIYTIIFLDYSFDILFLIIELSLIAICIALTHVSHLIYKSLNKKPIN
jgi:uncharacterized membrane protein YhaH (DUF805 family)